MSIKHIVVPDIGEVRFQKRRGTRTIRIHIVGSEARVTLPNWVPYKTAVAFVSSRKNWVKDHIIPKELIVEGMLVGKKHQILVEQTKNKTLRTAITNGAIICRMPENGSIEDPAVQAKLQMTVEKALLQESQELITPLVQDLSMTHNLPYKSLSYKKLKSRWGSCDQSNNLVLNTYLVQLSWQEIEYVIVHELAHTKQHNHSKKFWSIVAECMPNYKEIRKQMKIRQPNIVVS
jgi:predicted metal-dependent hydrolase